MSGDSVQAYAVLLGPRPGLGTFQKLIGWSSASRREEDCMYHVGSLGWLKRESHAIILFGDTVI